MIRRAATVTAERIDGGRVRVTIAPAGAGHAFPTGDLFRRLEVRAEAVDGHEAIVARAPSVALQRSFADRPRDAAGADLTFQRVPARDTRVAPPGGAPSTVELALPEALPEARVRWRVVYQRMATPMAEAFGIEQARDEITVAEGELPAVATAQTSLLLRGERR
jgi:hypothetical protein